MNKTAAAARGTAGEQTKPQPREQQTKKLIRTRMKKGLHKEKTHKKTIKSIKHEKIRRQEKKTLNDEKST